MIMTTHMLPKRIHWQ